MMINEKDKNTLNEALLILMNVPNGQFVKNCKDEALCLLTKQIVINAINRIKK